MIRSLLYVPASAERFVARAHERGADAIILDLEDAIPPDGKEAARAHIAHQRMIGEGFDCLGKIRGELRHIVDDPLFAHDPDILERHGTSDRMAGIGEPVIEFIALFDQERRDAVADHRR